MTDSPHLTIRTRLTLLYAAVFTVTGAGLLTVMYLLIRQDLFYADEALAQDLTSAVSGIATRGTPAIPATPLSRDYTDAIAAVARTSTEDILRTIIIESAVAFAAMAALALLLCWLVAGRALRPLRRITDLAGRLSQETLDSRIALDGPRDEIRELADTFDGMLDRLGRGFTAQQLFAANASHELRTPLTIIQTAAEATLARPSRPEADYRRALETIATAAQRSERLLASLLRLAQARRQLDWARVDLAQAAEQALGSWPAGAPQLTRELRSAAVAADPVLLNLLLGNLIENAVRYNVEQGTVRVRVKPTDSGATLYVENTGPVLTAQEVAELRQPFRRGDTRPLSGSGSGSGSTRDSSTVRDSSSTIRDSGGSVRESTGSVRESTGSAPRSDGFGLGLAIVDAIVAAHDGRWSARPRSSGGLEVRVDLPANLDRLT